MQMPTLFAFLLAGLEQQLVWRVANAAGLFTNIMFLMFRTGVMAACYGHTDEIGGLSPLSATSFAAITQAILMVAPQWGGMLGLTNDVRSGQIGAMLLRPVDPYLAYLLTRLGASVFMVFGRMLPILTLSWALGLLVLPAPGAAMLFAVSLLLGALVALEIQMLVECSSLWLHADHGVRMLVYGIGVTASGLLLPLSWYPESLQNLCRSLPFSSTLNTPTEIWLGIATPYALLGQLFWVVALGVAGHVVLQRGLRRLVVFGG